MNKTININKVKLNEQGEIVKKKNTIKHSKDNALEKPEQEELIRQVKALDIRPQTKQRYLMLVYLLLESGLRISEAIQVRLDWFNETEDGITINIPEKARDLKNLKRDWKPKTEAGKREVIFLSDSIGSSLATYFVDKPLGLGFSRQRAYQIIKELGISMNKPGLHPHALRSTYANNLVYAGVNDSTLCYYMGWSDLNTARNYVKTSKIAARADLKKCFEVEK